VQGWACGINRSCNLMQQAAAVHAEPELLAASKANHIHVYWFHVFHQAYLTFARSAAAAAVWCVGFTAVDTLAFGALGHMAGVGIVLGLRATGGL
jgi:hypothetical protein